MTAIYVDPNGSDAANGLTPATAVASFHVGWNRALAALPTAATSPRVLLLAEDDVIHNVTATGFLTQAHNTRGAGIRIETGTYGSGDRATVTARSRVTGWEAVPPHARLVRAPCAVDTWDLWGDAISPRRAREVYGAVDGPRVLSFDPNTKSVLIPPAGLPDVEDFDGLLFKMFVGWSVSYLPVANIVPEGGNYRVTFVEPAATMEFAKGTNLLTGPYPLGMAFVPGPYHNNGGIRFFWENRREFLTEAGDWSLDRANDMIYALMPEGQTVAEWEAGGLYIPNGVTSVVQIFSPTASPKAGGCDIKKINFRNIGFIPVNWNEGYIGYLSGSGFYASGTQQLFRETPAAIRFYNCASVSITDCGFSDMSVLGVRGFDGVHGLYLARLDFRRMGSAAVVVGGPKPFGTSTIGVPWVGLDQTPMESQNLDLLAEDIYCEDIGFQRTGSVLFFGLWRRARVQYCAVVRCADDAISISDGSRINATWEQDVEISNCLIVQAMMDVVDGGAIYSAGNSSGANLTATPLLQQATNRGARVRHNKITDIRKAANDPDGGKSAAIYFDLGCVGNVAFSNVFERCDLAFKENATKFNRFTNNRLVDVAAERDVTYSGAQVYPPGSNTPTRVNAPLDKPPSATDLSNFPAFQAVFPFATANDVVIAEVPGEFLPEYNSLSTYSNNGSGVAIGGVHYGPRPWKLRRAA